jgi:hypothetical protein
MAMQQADFRSKMAIVEIGFRGKETVISWATGDRFALECVTKIASQRTTTELYWRKASASEIKALEKQRGNGKLPGW